MIRAFISFLNSPLRFSAMSSSRGLGLEVIRRVTPKGKKRLSGLLVLCLSPQGEPLPLLDMSSSGG
jgi:hypothetical protein